MIMLCIPRDQKLSVDLDLILFALKRTEIHYEILQPQQEIILIRITGCDYSSLKCCRQLNLSNE